MAESAFSEDAKYFSAISHDGRLRIWDTETNVLLQEYTPDLHLTAPPSCLLWFYLASSQSFRKGKQKSSEDESQYVALGTTNGKILIYSVAQANVETVIEDKRNIDKQGIDITALDWHRKYGLFSCNKGGYVQEWDIRSGMCRYQYNVLAGSNNRQASIVSAIKLIPHSQNTQSKFLATASWQILVWHVLDGAASVVMTLGHTGAKKPLLSLAVLNQKSWLISGSQNERLLSFWDVSITQEHIPVPRQNGTDSPAKKQRRKLGQDNAIVIPTPTYNFVLEDAPKMVDACLREENESVKVELLATTRSGVVHYYGHVLNGSSLKPIKPTVSIQVSTPEARPLPLQGASLARTGAALAYSLGARIVFERLTPDPTNKTQVLIRGDTKLNTNRQRNKDIVNKVRGGEVVTYVEPMGGVTRKRATPGAKIEVPMEARLENLSVDHKKRNKWAVSQNLTKLLMQGLQSKDNYLLHTVLQNNDPGVALRSCQALPPAAAAPLLDTLADYAQGKTQVCASVVTWAGALVRSQAALLLAAPPAAARLAALLAVFTQRRSHLCQLLNLKGRLSLSAAQRSAPPAERAVLEYNDESSSDENEMELPRSESESMDEFDSDKQEDMEEDDE